MTADLEAVYSYNQEGMLISQSYPLGTTYQYTYDAMGRPTKMTDTGAGQDLVSTVTYGPAGELLTMTGTSVGETRTYNSMGQLTQLTGLNGVNLKYNYAAGANNGQIASQQDVVSGETTTYAYDSLKRLAAAVSTQGWNQSFGYDGFGNLTSKTGSGIAPVGSYPADPATNRISGVAYDLNGNQLAASGSTLVYDVANRMISSTGSSVLGVYEYDAWNQRVYQQKQHYNGSAWVTDALEFYFFGLNGRKIGTFTPVVSGSGTGGSISWSALATQVFFQGHLIRNSLGTAQADIRGSIGKYFPYGEEITIPATLNDTVKFATYTRDSVSAIDYAHQRYYSSVGAKFLSPDPWSGASRPIDPTTWNRYLYVSDDPVNKTDPWGMDDEKKFCDIYPDYPACQPFNKSTMAPPITVPTGSFGINPFEHGLTGLAGAGAAFARMTDSCAKGLGAPDVQTAMSDLYRLLYNGTSSDLGFSSSLTTDADGGASYRYSFTNANFNGVAITWNSNAALADPTHVYLGQDPISGAYYYIDLVANFGKTFNLNAAFMYSSWTNVSTYQAIYLLHELGHFYNKSITSGDDVDMDANRKNTQVVIDSCFKDLKF